jgi:hypothetical protein
MDKTIMKECPKHGLTEHVLLPSGSYKCKECRKDAVIDIRRRNKIKLVEYKGGKCERCGYDKCIDALEFHHLNPDEKDFGLSCGDTRSLEKLKKEVDKCIMVCANCHREIHAEEREKIRIEKEREELERSRLYFENKHNDKKVQSKKLIEEKLKLDNIKSDISIGLTKKEISKKYKVSLTTLRRFLDKNELVYIEYKGGKLCDLSINDFLNSFKELKSFTSVGKKYGVSDKALQKWCERNGLPWRKKELVEYIDKK